MSNCHEKDVDCQKGMNAKAKARDTIGGGGRLKAMLAVPLILMFIIMPLLTVQGVMAASNPSIVVTSNVSSLVAGAYNDVTLKITNTGDFTASQVNLSIALPNSPSGSAVMILKGTDNKFELGDIGANSSINLKITLYVSTAAVGNLYQISYTFMYIYETTKTDTRTLGYIVPALDTQGAVLSVGFSQNELVAGQNNSLNLTVTNIGDAEAKVITVSLTLPGAGASSSPLSLMGSDGKWIFDSIPVNQSIVIPMTVFASPSSVGSVYQVPVALTYSDNTKTKQDTRYLALGVPYTNAPAANLDVNLSSQDLRAGFTNNLNLTINNVGNSTAQSLTVSLTLPGSQSTSSPYVLMGGDGIWLVDSIAPGGEVTIPLSIFIAQSAASTGSTFTVTIAYTDQQYKLKQQVSSIGVVVRGTVDLVVLDSSTFPQNIIQGMPFSFSITLINLGTTTAQSVRVMPSGADGITPFSDSIIFLGDLAVNIPSSLTISYMAGNINNGTYNISIDYTYKNALGQQISDNLTTTMKITVGTNSSSSNGTGQQATPWSLMNIIIFGLPIAAVLIIALYLIRRYRSRSKK